MAGTAIFSVFRALTRSGWPLRRLLTKSTTWSAPSEAGWGGVVWKTLGSIHMWLTSADRVTAPCAVTIAASLGLNNIELITDRTLDINLEEITRIKQRWPDRAVVVSIMVPCEEEAWKWIPAAG